MAELLTGVLAGMLFGLLTVAVRRGLIRVPDAVAGSMVITSTAALIVLGLTIATGVGGDLLDVRTGLVYAAIGVVVPGISQILFVVSVREVGASRAAIMIGTAPLLATIIAVGFRGEPLKAGLIAGTVLIVVGGASLAWERNLPAGFRARGMLFAFACAMLFALRDNAVRVTAGSTDMDPRAGTAWALIGAASAVAVYAIGTRRSGLPQQVRAAFRPFLVPGVALGLGYTALVLALHVGRVTVIAPLNATQSLWAVLLAWLLLGKSDSVGPRVVMAGLLVVSGGILIGVFR